MNYIISHDVGTQSSKAVLIGTDGKVYDSFEQEYGIDLPRPGWVEQNPEDYWDAICNTTRQIVKKLKDKKSVLAMVFSTQAMGIIPVDENGRLLYPNISWVDARAGSQSVKIMNRFLGKPVFKKITGVELSGKDVIPKLLWIKEQLPEVYQNTCKFLDVNGFLKYRCTGNMVAEWSGACSYGFDLNKKDWERTFFKISGIDVDKLPDLVRSTDLVGTLTQKAARELGLPESVKIFGGCDDTQSAAMGSGQTGHHEAHIYLGSSAWVGISTQKNYKFKNGVASLQSADPESSFLVGITESAGVNIEWALKKLYKEEQADGKDVYRIMEKEVSETPAGADHLLFTPWFQGERAPVTSTTTRSTLFNLSLEHNRGHIMTAMLEGIGYNLKWTVNNIKRDYGISIGQLTVIGGGSQNAAWMQSLSNILNVDINITKNPKLGGAIGSAMIALVGLGIEKDFSKIKEMNPVVRTFKPAKDHQEVYQEMFENYRSLYYSLKKTYHRINFKRYNRESV